ncbi:MAG: DUF4011 domain-containing protein [Bacilli bacterium]|nr:DUF4011 domain-containing protein [Bacilli bacterium]
MKMLKEADYRIQSNNGHLKNILEENYYIELGCINYKVLSRLLAGEETLISDCIYSELTSVGIGQISEEAENSLTYQLAYLMHLRKKSSSCKIFLTCNFIKYYDKEKRELYAPIVLIPVNIDYQKGIMIKASEAIPNQLLLKELANLTGFEMPYPDRLNTLTQIDNFSFELSKKSHCDLQIGNFLTYANVEYPDYKGDNERFDIERSIYEFTPKAITDEYYKNVKAIMPTNIQQKYVILKAAKGESFAVDGRLGSGKTYTILNIVADFIAKGKKVLYVNQDSDALARFENELYKHHMGVYTHNFDQIYPIDHQIEILLPELKSDVNEVKIPDELFEYEEALNEKHHGLTYKQMTEVIAYLNNKYPSLELIPIENSLEHFEIAKVRDYLEKIEANLKYIDELKDNIWANIEDYYNHQHQRELINAVTEYKNAQLDFNKYFMEFCTRYEIAKPDNFIEAHRLISDVRTFSLTKVPPKWSNSKVYKEAHLALDELSKDISSLNVLERNYEKLVVNTYCKGDAERILDTIKYKHLKDNADNHINQLLSPYSPLGQIINDLRRERQAIRYASNELEELLEIQELPNDIYSFLTKIEQLLSHTNVQSNWVKMFVSNKAEHLNVNKTLENLIMTSQELHDDILQYAIRPEMFKYENLKLMTNNDRFERIVSSNFDRRVMRANKKSADRLYQTILEFMDMVSEVIKLASRYSLISNAKMEDFCESYRNWIDFTNNLSIEEYDYLVSLVQKNDLYYLLKNNSFLNIVLDFNERVETINGIFNHMLIYGINIDGVGVLEKLSNIDEWIDYLIRVINCKEQLYSLFINNASITYKDVMQLIGMDREYYALFEKTEEKGMYYYSLLGESYQGLYTDCNAISILMEHFEAFQEKLINKRHITSLLSTFGFKQMVEEYGELEVLSERVSSSHRVFSRFFKGGQTSLLECDLNKAVQIIRQYEVKTNQLTYMFEILESLRYFDKLGLYSLVAGIKNSEYTTMLAERYIYSTYKIYREELINKHPILNESFKILEYFDDLEDAELGYCLNNISNLMALVPDVEKKIKDRRGASAKFNEYNKMIEFDLKNCLIFLANVDVFNSDLILSLFDVIIVDDCHIASSNKYHRIDEAPQVLLFGDKGFRTSVSNSLLNRINPGTIVHYNRRYLGMSDYFKNDWHVKNQYIYDFNQKVKVEKQASVKSLVEMVVHYYNQNPKPDLTINIVVFSSSSRRKIYSELVNKLLENLDTSEVIKLLANKFNIINGSNEDASYADVAIIMFDDIRDYEISSQELILRNFTCVSDQVILTYLDNKDDILNKEIEAGVKAIMMESEKKIPLTTPFTELIIDRMKERKLDAEAGFGMFDIVVRNQNKANVGIIIEGSVKNDSYFLVDDYQYYYGEYIKKGWNVFVFFMEDIIDNLDKRIDEVVTLVINDDDNANQLSFIDEDITNE